ncbi:MAG: hypothetical protein ACREDK_08200 [Thermoplasmata archaeon]
MYPPSVPASNSAHRDLGIALILGGIALVVLALFLASICVPWTPPPNGPAPPIPTGCVAPFLPIAFLLGLIALVMLILGCVYAASRALVAIVPPFVPVPWTPGPPSATVVAPEGWIACRGCGRIHHLGRYAYCMHCGSKLIT